MYSNTKVVTAAAVWMLVEDGLLRFNDPIAQHIPEFAANGKAGITVLQLLTHQAGFPGAVVPEAAWADHALLRQTVSNFSLEWTPGSKVQYHPAAAHWTAAVLIEAITGQDFRRFITDRVIAPLGLADEISWACRRRSRPRRRHLRRAGGRQITARMRRTRWPAAPQASRAAAATAPRAAWRPSTRCWRRAAC